MPTTGAAAITNTDHPPNSASETLSLINHLLSLLLASCLSAKSFVSRFLLLHSTLSAVQTSLSDISAAPHWPDNPLLLHLLPSLLPTLRRLHSLSSLCVNLPFSGGKLQFQSDLDAASTALSDHLRHLDLLLRSGLLRHHSSAIVLSRPAPGSSSKEDLIFYIRDLFTRIQIGGVEFKQKALESLIELLSDDEKSASIVAKEGNVPYLIQLLDFHHFDGVIREQAVNAVSILASSSDQSRKIMFEEGGLGPLLRVLDTGTLALKEKAAATVESITADSENAWAVAAYGGVSILVEACRCGSLLMKSHAAGAIRNVSIIEDVRNALVEENAVPVLIDLLDSCDGAAVEKAANCLSILASSSGYICAVIVEERGLQRIVQLVHESTDFETLEHGLRAIQAISTSDSIAKTLASSSNFIIHLADLIKHGNLTLQQISINLLSNLPISDAIKREISSCIPQLLKLMEMPKPAGIQDAASKALVSLLSVKSNRKELVRDEKSLMRLVQMMDVKNEAVCKEFPVAVMAALGGGGDKKRLTAAGAVAAVQRLAEMDVAGAKKAAQRLSGNRLKGILSRTWREL